MFRNLKICTLIIVGIFFNIQYSASQNRTVIAGNSLNLDSIKTHLLEKNLVKIFKKHAIFKLSGIEKFSKTLKSEKFFQVELVLGSMYDWSLDLEQYNLKEARYLRRVAQGNEVKESVGESIITYRGFVNGNPESKARISAINGKLTGVILQGDKEI